MKLLAITGRRGSVAQSESLRQLSIGCEQMSNSNITEFRNSTKSSGIMIYVISNPNKTACLRGHRIARKPETRKGSSLVCFWIYLRVSSRFHAHAF